MKNYFITSIIFSLFLFTSCRTDTIKPTPSSNVTPDATNNFVWKAMNSWYYWQSQSPNLVDNVQNDNAKYTGLINGKTPNDLFYKDLVYQYGKTDRFSWIENNNVIVNASSKMAETKPNTGLDISLFPKGGGSSNFVALVNYVIPNSSAANAGLKRGDVITKVNGAPLSASNRSVLFDADSFTISRAETAVSEVVNGSYVVRTTDKDENIPIVKTSIDENPIAFYKVFEMGGKKIGYLVYNGFKIDYNDELNAQFAKMKADGITELILDLRYNGGGSLTSAVGLAQMINGNYTGSNYVYMEYNSKHSKYNGYDVLSDNIDIYNVVNGHEEKIRNEKINSLSLPKIYTLISFQTASASELTVTSLSKFINVETIGYVTVGKFVGSHTLYDSPDNDYINYEKRNKSHNWQLQPITFQYFNKDRDPHPKVTYADGTVEEGLLPNQQNRVHPYQCIGTVKEFGNTSDPELKRALELITGQTITSKIKSAPFVDTKQRVISKPTNAALGLYIHDISDYLKRKKN